MIDGTIECEENHLGNLHTCVIIYMLDKCDNDDYDNVNVTAAVPVIKLMRFSSI